MADWGSRQHEAFMAKLAALRGAREGTLRRGQSMREDIRGIGQTIGGGLGRISDKLFELGGEKRGREHDIAMEKRREKQRGYEQSVEHRQETAEKTKERMSREEQAELDRENRKEIAALGEGGTDRDEFIMTVEEYALNRLWQFNPELKDELGNLKWADITPELAEELRNTYRKQLDLFKLTGVEKQRLMDSFEAYLVGGMASVEEEIPDDRIPGQPRVFGYVPTDEEVEWGETFLEKWNKVRALLDSLKETPAAEGAEYKKYENKMKTQMSDTEMAELLRLVEILAGQRPAEELFKY